MIVSHDTVRRYVVAALMSNPTGGVEAAMAAAAERLALPFEAVADVIDSP